MPSLLLSVSLGQKAAAAEAPFPWPRMPPLIPTRTMLRAYEVRLHLFMGKNLPAKDDNGVLDPYATATLAGAFALGSGGKPRSRKEVATAHPQWFEYLILQAWLPPLEFAPDLLVDVWDADERWGRSDHDDFVGTASLSLLSAHLTSGMRPAELAPPSWVPLRPRRYEGGGGEVATYC